MLEWSSSEYVERHASNLRCFRGKHIAGCNRNLKLVVQKLNETEVRHKSEIPTLSYSSFTTSYNQIKKSYLKRGNKLRK